MKCFRQAKKHERLIGEFQIPEQAQSSTMFAPKFKAKAPSGSGIWTPKSQTPTSSLNNLQEIYINKTSTPPPPPPKRPIWTPQPSPVGTRREFRPIRFESPTLPRRYVLQTTPSNSKTVTTAPLPPWSDEQTSSSCALLSPRSVNSCTNLSSTTAGSSSLEPCNDQVNLNGDRPSAGVSDKIRSFERSSSTSELIRPFQRRQHEPSRPVNRPNEVIFKVKNEYMSEPELEQDHPRKMALLRRVSYDGIGPVTKDGMPIILRSEVKQPHQHEWYKRLYQTIHKQKNGERYPYKSGGYQSEPEPNYDSDYTTIKYRTGDRRRMQSVSSAANVRDEKLYGTMPNPLTSSQPLFKNQPGRIEDYITGHSTATEKEKKDWWDEVMDIFNGHLDQTKLPPHYTKGNLSRALAKESGYTSDSNLVFHKKELLPSSQLSPIEQKQVYKSVQSGGEPPLLGFRKPAPEKPRVKTTDYIEEVEYIQISPTLTKIRILTKKVDNTKQTEVEKVPTSTAIPKEPATKDNFSPTIASIAQTEISAVPKVHPNFPTKSMFTPFPKHLPSFIPLTKSSPEKSAPPVPAPPQRGTAIVRAANDRLVQVRSRHEQCFQSPDSNISVGNRYGTITLSKQGRHEQISRSKSAGAVPTLLAAFSAKETCSEAEASGQHARVSPTRRQTTCITTTHLRQASRSPVAFGRSISRERTFAEEKKRLENVLPRSRNTFEASTNILRDPSLKSPKDVKAAVRSYATCNANHWRSKSVPRLNESKSNVTVNTTVRHTMCFPQLHKSQTTTYYAKPTQNPKTTHSPRKQFVPLRSASAKNLPKNVSTVSLARTNSTYSLESTTVVTPKQKSTTIEHTTKSKIVTKKSTQPTAKTALVSSKSDSNIRHKISAQKNTATVQKCLKKPTTSKTAKLSTTKATTPSREQKEIKSMHYFKQGTAPERNEKTLSWHECTQSLTTPRVKSTSYYNTRSLSPRGATEFTNYYEYSDDMSEQFAQSNYIDDLVWQYEQRAKLKAATAPTENLNLRKFSPTREIRVPQSPVASSYVPHSLPLPARKFSPTPEVRVPLNKPNIHVPTRPKSPAADYAEKRKCSPTREVRVAETEISVKPMFTIYQSRAKTNLTRDVRDIARPDSPSPTRRFSPTREIRLEQNVNNTFRQSHFSSPRSPRDVRDIARPDSPSPMRRFSPTREVRLKENDTNTFAQSHFSRSRSPRDVRDIARPDSPTPQRGFSPTREIRLADTELVASLSNNSFYGQSPGDVSDIARPASPNMPRHFSPTREIRVPQSPRCHSPDFFGEAERSVLQLSAQRTTREVRVPQTRSPSRRRIDSCRSHARNSDTNKVIRASSLSSADERTQRGLYLCDQFAHSATLLSQQDRHSPNCRYGNNSERYTDLNRFYTTLERVGQLERATSETSFKPLRKESEILDFDEWRRVKLYERAEKELNYLVNKLKHDQREKDLLFRSKDVEDIRWRKEDDFGLHAKEKSVEDLRVDFERKLLLKEFNLTRGLTQDVDSEFVKPYWRRNTVADLTSSIEAKNEHESLDESLKHFNKDLVSSLSKEQILKVTQQLNEIYAQEPNQTATTDISEKYVVTVNGQKPAASVEKRLSALKVRSNSSITKEELLGPVIRKKHALAHTLPTPNRQRHELRETENSKRATSPVLIPRETRGALAALHAELKQLRPVKDSNKFESSKFETPVMDLSVKKREPPKEQISQKIQYFEERQFDEPTKTIYHAREDSSPDEEEVMRIVEQNIKERANKSNLARETNAKKSAFRHHKELSNSLTDLSDIYGERNTARVNFHMHTPPERPPDELTIQTSQVTCAELPERIHVTDVTEIDAAEEPYSFCSSTELYTANTEFHDYTRCSSPQSQASSIHQQRGNAGEVQKICQKFESIGHCNESNHERDHFFGVSTLRKARSDSELHSASDSESKDALKAQVEQHEHGDVAWMTHKFEVRNKVAEDVKSQDEHQAHTRQPKRAVSPTNSKAHHRLMPHIDIISKSAALKSAMKPASIQPSSIGLDRACSPATGTVELIKKLYESPSPAELSNRFLSTSNPDLTEIGAHLSADWIAHKYSSPERAIACAHKHKQAICKARRHRRSNSASPPRPPKRIHHKQTTNVANAVKPYYDDIFANQHFDPSKHQPKARYVPKDDNNDEVTKNLTTTNSTTTNVNTNRKKITAAHATSCAGHCNILKKSVAVTFEDQDYAPPVPPQPNNKQLGENPTHKVNGNRRSDKRRDIRMQSRSENSYHKSAQCPRDYQQYHPTSQSQRMAYQTERFVPTTNVPNLKSNYNFLTQKANHAHERRQGLQKLHRSCGNLNSDATNSNTSYVPSQEFHQMHMWRRQKESEEAPSNSAYISNSSNCPILNCGKILWVSKQTEPSYHLNGLPDYPPSDLYKKNSYKSGAALPQMPTTSFVQRNSAPVIIRTNAKGLPSTPLPEKRQSYLANQHAIEASVPLVMREYRKSKSPNRYFESDVNIHFKTPVRHEFKEPIPEAELAARQAEQMQKLYQEERRRKYLQELQDMNSRRHTDNFTPSQKSPIPLNRYDDFPAPRTVARALYNFQGQGARELSFRKGDIIYLRRQIDSNWYEGEHNAMIGLLPANYIEIINRDAGRPQSKKPSEGQARAKYNFQAQSGVELSLNKGELVTLTRRVDENWFEGKIANRKGIFPVSYVEVLVDIGANDNEPKAIISDYSTTNLKPSLDVLRTNINNEFNIITQNGQQPPNGILKGVQHKTEALHVDTRTEPITYRALYKYRPQNSDELELLEGDLVHVLEKCDDGWFVGTSQRTGCFGTFPGNYVERV